MSYYIMIIMSKILFVDTQVKKLNKIEYAMERRTANLAHR